MKAGGSGDWDSDSNHGFVTEASLNGSFVSKLYGILLN
jgi:hypothetical protein